MPSAHPEEQDLSMVDVDAVDEVQEDEEAIDEDDEIEIGENRVTVVCFSLSLVIFRSKLHRLYPSANKVLLAIRCHRDSSVVSIQRRRPYTWKCPPICDYEKVGNSSILLQKISEKTNCCSPGVEFCGYTIPHPSEAKMNLRIQTYGKFLRPVLTETNKANRAKCRKHYRGGSSRKGP